MLCYEIKWLNMFFLNTELHLWVGREVIMLGDTTLATQGSTLPHNKQQYISNKLYIKLMLKHK